MTLKVMKKRQIIWTTVLLIIGFLWMCPLIFMISMSLRKPEKAFEPVLFLFPLVLQNFKLVFRQNNLLPNFISSLIITSFSVFLVTLTAAMAAFGLTRKQVAGKTIIYNTLMLTLMVPISALVIPLTQINSALGWINTYQGLIFPYTALGIPFGLVIIKAFLENVPSDLEDAAIVDGCGVWRLFFLVILPVIRSGLIVVMIWQFLTSWNEFFLALVTMSETAMKTLTLIPMQYQGFYFSQPGALFAILVVICTPMILFYIAVQKYFVRGMLSGAIKG